MGAGGAGIEVGRVSLNDIKRNLRDYIDSAVPGGSENFTVEEVYDGLFGSRFGATREGLVIYQIKGEGVVSRVKIAEVGIITKAQTSLQKVGSSYAEQATYVGPDKKHHPVYVADRDVDPSQRIFSESKLARLAQSKANGSVTRS